MVRGHRVAGTRSGFRQPSAVDGQQLTVNREPVRQLIGPSVVRARGPGSVVGDPAAEVGDP